MSSRSPEIERRSGWYENAIWIYVADGSGPGWNCFLRSSSLDIDFTLLAERTALYAII